MPHEYMASYQVPNAEYLAKIYHVELILWQKISNWAQLVIISFSSAVRVAKCYSKHQHIFVGFSEMLKKIASYPSVDERARILKWAQTVKLNLR